ncbi:Cytochrome b succinate dehydrogenase small subunit CybS [Penicillium riverlandense]|uniref:Cytochrome b succinate dehydrogenase small subunit CybS n=1 Tax=Penicillium riverlandense TaxID=1903569 RepID=UPI0025490E5A|nr:Cytochrome b succinate dehydrogenase small subunit CybS [Penicillium riverlandense]KAJ5819204.1 Cytochrome b succinate dehydrogenase small subunit CybS [Penicillium riverlandense]
MASIVRSSPLLRQSLATPRSSLLSKNVGVSQLVAFHASARKQILPPQPLNDPAPIPETHPSEGSYHWSFERLVCVGLIPVTIAPFAAGSFNPVMDAVLCSLLVAHSHVGFQASIIDYFPAARVPKTRTFLNWLLRAFTLTTAVGLYEFETNDVGLTEGLRRVWTA